MEVKSISAFDKIVSEPVSIQASTPVPVQPSINTVVNANNGIKSEDTRKATRKNLLVAASTLVATGTIAAYYITKHRGTISELRSQASESRNRISTLLEENTNLKSITETQSDLNSAPKKSFQDYYNQFKNLIKGETKLNYDPLKPIDSSVKNEGKELVPISGFQSTPALHINPLSEIKPEKLMEELQSKNEVNISLTSLTPINSVKPSTANIPVFMEKEIGQVMQSDMTINAGETANWSFNKIARDIMQNFYDGHGHTLGGTNLNIRKLENGLYKIRVNGNSTYNPEYIKGIGLTSKSENLANAGGFGEGSKIVNASMMAKGITDKVIYGSADWMYEITNDGRYLQRKLNKTDFLDGNFIEFETKNKKFVNAMLESLNFFEHEGNKDFYNLTYKNNVFGFKYLGPEKKGNMYLTQRFEYGENGSWQNGVEGLNVIIKEKPESELYETLNEASFALGRDRTSIKQHDFKNLAKYYVNEMSEEEALKCVVEMQSGWPLAYTEKEPAYKILLKSLCNKFGYDSKKLDFSKEKYFASYYGDERIHKDTIERLGLVPCDGFLDKIGMPDIREVLARYSTHKPVQPTQKEIKQITLLNEATKVVHESFTQFDKEIIKELSQNYNGKIIDRPLFDYTMNRGVLEDFDSLLNKINDIFESKHKTLMEEMEKRFSSSSKPDKFSDFPQELKNAFYDAFEESLGNTMKDLDKKPPEVQDEAMELLKILRSNFLLDPECESLVSKISKVNEPVIKSSNLGKPVCVFDSVKEGNESILGQASVRNNEDRGWNERGYFGHWVSRKHLEENDFGDLLSTWLHEISHQYGGDSQSVFGYKLTDLLAQSFRLSDDAKLQLKAIGKAYSEI